MSQRSLGRGEGPLLCVRWLWYLCMSESGMNNPQVDLGVSNGGDNVFRSVPTREMGRQFLV